VLILEIRPDATVALRRGSGGAFEIVIDSKLVYSKLATGRFPESSEITAALR